MHQNNAPEHVVIAGLMHDVVEDEDYTLPDIRDEFGVEMATLADVVFEPEELINADVRISKTWNECKAHSIDLIDRLGDGVWDIFNALKDSVAWYYISMLNVFGNRDEGIRDMPAFKEFEKCVGEMFGYGLKRGCRGA
jgi:hypothetical protein